MADSDQSAKAAGKARGQAEDDGATTGKTEDAITLLKNDHRSVEALFEQFENASRRAEKQKLARQACQELIVHAMIEEELFYPACREFVDDDMLDEAQVEHDSAKALIIELLEGSPAEAFFDAKVKVLAEHIRHHVQEEEKRNEGIFAKAKAGGLDVDALGQQLTERKAQLLQAVQNGEIERPQPVAFVHALRPVDEEGRREARSRNGGSRQSSQSARGDDEERNRGSRMPDRDERGRFISEEDEDDRRPSRMRGEDDRDDRNARFRDETRRSQSRRDSYRDDRDERAERSRSRDDEEYRRRDDDMRRAERRSPRDEDEDEGGRGGWFGDSEGHARAARRGWDDRH